MALFRGVLKGSKLSAEIESLEFLSNGVALVHTAGNGRKKSYQTLCSCEIRLRLADQIVPEYTPAAVQRLDHALDAKSQPHLMHLMARVQGCLDQYGWLRLP